MRSLQSKSGLTTEPSNFLNVLYTNIVGHRRELTSEVWGWITLSVASVTEIFTVTDEPQQPKLCW